MGCVLAPVLATFATTGVGWDGEEGKVVVKLVATIAAAVVTIGVGGTEEVTGPTDETTAGAEEVLGVNALLKFGACEFIGGAAVILPDSSAGSSEHSSELSSEVCRSTFGIRYLMNLKKK